MFAFIKPKKADIDIDTDTEIDIEKDTGTGKGCRGKPYFPLFEHQIQQNRLRMITKAVLNVYFILAHRLVYKEHFRQSL